MRQGKVAYFQTFGFQDRAAQTTMQSDSIFRLASLTKPVTAVAALMLAEEGKLQLMDPVSVYLPQLKQLQVGVEVKEGSGERHLTLEPARREVTVQDLMRHTSGMTYGIFGDSLVQRAYRAAGTMDDQQTNADLIDKLAKLPLAFQPGTAFEYGMSNDVIGRIVEVQGGVDLNKYIVERIARPLGMNNTAFLLEPAQTTKLAQPQPIPGAPPVVIGYNPAKPPKWFSGGGGLLSTAEDYARFGQMLLNGGELDGVRVLSRKSVELMTSNHLPPGIGLRCVHPGIRPDCATAAVWTRLRAGRGRARRSRSQHGAGFGRRLLLGRRHRPVLLGRSERRTRGRDDAPGRGHSVAHSLPFAVAKSGLSGFAMSNFNLSAPR